MNKPWKNNNNNYPPYLYATNMAVSDRRFIVRTASPRFIAETILFENEEQAHHFMAQQPFISVMAHSKRKVLVVTVLEYWEDTSNYTNEELHAITKRLAYWYREMIWLSKQKQNNQTPSDNS